MPENSHGGHLNAQLPTNSHMFEPSFNINANVRPNNLNPSSVSDFETEQYQSTQQHQNGFIQTNRQNYEIGNDQPFTNASLDNGYQNCIHEFDSNRNVFSNQQEQQQQQQQQDYTIQSNMQQDNYGTSNEYNQINSLDPQFTDPQFIAQTFGISGNVNHQSNTQQNSFNNINNPDMQNSTNTENLNCFSHQTSHQIDNPNMQNSTNTENLNYSSQQTSHQIDNTDMQNSTNTENLNYFSQQTSHPIDNPNMQNSTNTENLNYFSHQTSHQIDNTDMQNSTNAENLNCYSQQTSHQIDNTDMQNSTNTENLNYFSHQTSHQIDNPDMQNLPNTENSNYSSQQIIQYKDNISSQNSSPGFEDILDILDMETSDESEQTSPEQTNHLSPSKPPDFTIEEDVFPRSPVKSQVRKTVDKNIDSRQKPKAENVVLNLVFDGPPHELDWVTEIKVFVHNNKRSKKAQIHILQIHIERTDRMKVEHNKIKLTFDLNNLVEPEDQIYELTTSRKKDSKKFHFSIEVHYNCFEKPNIKETNSFTLFGSEKAKKNAEKPKTKKRKVNEPIGQCIPNQHEFDNSHHYERLPDEEPNDHIGNEKTANFAKLIVQDLEAQNLHVKGSLNVDGKADIGYHFELGDDEEDFEEGEVVGLVPRDSSINADNFEECNEQQLRAVKLTNETAKKAVLKGVVTESHYIAANKKDPSKRSIVLCMMGIVPVKVKGSVRPNETLYAAPNRPGLAISGYHLEASEQKEVSVIGVTFGSRKTSDENSVGLVEAGVSILQQASHHLVDSKFRFVDDQIKNTKKSMKRRRRFHYGCCAVFILLLALLCILFWQLYYPGTAYRHWKCKQGHTKPLQRARIIRYKSKKDQTVRITAHGIRFEFKDILRKIELSEEDSFQEPISGIVDGVDVGEARYYLGFYRCAYGDSFAYRKTSGGTQYTGPRMFAIDEKCENAFWLGPDSWVRYVSPQAIQCDEKIHFP
eukprot:TCONS_00067876-protein